MASYMTIVRAFIGKHPKNTIEETCTINDDINNWIKELVKLEENSKVCTYIKTCTILEEMLVIQLEDYKMIVYEEKCQIVEELLKKKLSELIINDIIEDICWDYSKVNYNIISYNLAYIKLHDKKEFSMMIKYNENNYEIIIQGYFNDLEAHWCRQENENDNGIRTYNSIDEFMYSLHMDFI